MSSATGRAARQPAGQPGVTRFATRGNHRLSYESSGVDDGTPIIALHDLLADRRTFRALGETLQDRGFRVTLPDARGHGASPMISGRRYPTRELAADVVAVLDAEGLAAVHVVAIGWGAVVALELAATAPERIASLVLAEPYVPGLLTEQPGGNLRGEALRHVKVVQEAATAAEKGQTDRALDLFLGLRLGEGWRERMAKSRIAAIRRSAGSLAPLLAGMTADPPSRDALARIATPATILVPERAPMVVRGTGEVLASLVPRARIAEIRLEPNARSAPDGGWSGAITRVLIAGSK